MDRGKKTIASGSVPRMRALDLARTSTRSCDRKGCGERPGFTTEQKPSRAAALPEKGKKKSIPQLSQGKEKLKDQAATTNQVPSNPKTSVKLVSASKTGSPSHPPRYGLGRLSCSSSSVSDVVWSDNSKLFGSSSSSSSRVKGASGTSHFHDRQSDRSTPMNGKRVSSLSRNAGEPKSRDPVPYSIEGFTQLLRSLESLEREEALTHERLAAALVLEGFSFTDHYSDWRLDIDHMSYEELLDLEEKMGTVSTALSSEELADCLVSGEFEGENSNCSICQEEYEEGEEVVKLKCGHRFHRDCIRLWLGRKNWCPVCKSSAAQ